MENHHCSKIHIILGFCLNFNIQKLFLRARENDNPQVFTFGMIMHSTEFGRNTAAIY